MTAPWFEPVRSFLRLQLRPCSRLRKSGSAFLSPVWFRWRDGGFEVVIAEGDELNGIRPHLGPSENAVPERNSRRAAGVLYMVGPCEDP